MTTETFLEETTPQLKRPVKPLTSRLRKSKNFWKEDRMLDDYIDRTKLIGSGEKLLLKKMLKLRSREDSNVVKVTVTGLSKFLAVNVKTIRVWLRNLGQAGFIVPEGNIWEPHCNFPKKKFSFPETFPGFDLATVFIRRGAKLKHKAKQQKQPAPESQTDKEISNNEHAEGSFSEEITCPVMPRLIDCFTPSGGETSNFSPDTNVSSEKITKGSDAEGSASARHLSLPSERLRKKSFLDANPELKAFLVSFLQSKKVKTSIRYVSRKIDMWARENGTFRTRNDVKKFGEMIHDEIVEVVLPKEEKVPTLDRLLFLIQAMFESQGSESFWNNSLGKSPGVCWKTAEEFNANEPYPSKFKREFPTLVNHAVAKTSARAIAHFNQPTPNVMAA